MVRRGPAARSRKMRRARRSARRRLTVGVAVVSLLVPGWLVSANAGATTFDPHLLRAPYLTDLVGQHVLVNWSTDRSATTGSLRWGSVSGGTCSLTDTATATRTPLTVGSSSQYQWKASLTLPSVGTYCYRPYLATTDLLASNASPQFLSQVPAGATTPFSFGVMGDWGQVDSNGNNPDQANLMQRIASSGVRFMMTVGDNGYPSGSQKNYGDLVQTGADTSAIFGPSFWAVPGGSVPIFPAAGNHGLSGTTHADLTNWPQDVAVGSAGGRYQNDVYCCVNGTSSTNYASAWYAFDAGPARFYVLESAWGDTNPGNADVYANDAAAHFAPGTPEYQWLINDLQSHPSGLKFAVSHYPLYSDSKSQPSDTALQGPAKLEGLLAHYGVNMVFNGHAHIYERNVASSPGAPITYVTGGGGGVVAPIGPCHPFDAYGIGWSYSKSKGSACGSATAPTARSQVFHFLKVTVNGASVTVTPTDSLGNTFDVRTYTFGSTLPDTLVDTGPPSVTTATDATFAFRSTITPATYTCAIDGAPTTVCLSPMTYSGLRDGVHTFSVKATAAGGDDPTPAVQSWTVDRTAPSVPSGLTAGSSSPTRVNLTWNASSDASGVAAYDITRDGTPLTTVSGSTISFADNSVSGSTHYDYAIRARDGAGNASDFGTTASVTTPGSTPPVFFDSFESGNLSAWTSNSGLTVQGTLTHHGSFAARATTSNGSTYAKKMLPTTYADAWSRVYVNLLSTSSQVNLLRHRTDSDGSIAYVFVTAAGLLGLRNDVGSTTITSSTVLAPGSGWHAVELHTVVSGSASTVEVWLDGVRIDALSTSTDLGNAPVGRFQIGEVQSGRTYDVAFDEAAFGTRRIGL
jgi:hypothetical protein